MQALELMVYGNREPIINSNIQLTNILTKFLRGAQIQFIYFDAFSLYVA